MDRYTRFGAMLDEARDARGSKGGIYWDVGERQTVGATSVSSDYLLRGTVHNP